MKQQGKNPWRREENHMIERESLPLPMIESHQPLFEEILLAVYDGCRNVYQVTKFLPLSYDRVTLRVGRLVMAEILIDGEDGLSLSEQAKDWCEMQRQKPPEPPVILDCEVYRLALKKAKNACDSRDVHELK